MFKSVITPEMHYDDWARHYDSDVAGWDYHAPDRIVGKISDFLRYYPGQARMLDVGIGTGLLSRKCRALGHNLHVTGIDISSKMLDICNQQKIADDLRRVDVSHDRFPFDDGAFDVVAAAGLMENVENAHNAVAEMVRVTRPGGLIAFTYPPTTRPKEIERLAKKLRTGRTADGRFVMGNLMLYRHNPQEIEKAAHHAGARLLSCDRFVGYRTYVFVTVQYDLFVARKAVL